MKAYEKAVREKKLRTALSVKKKENEEYLQRVEKARISGFMQEKKEKKAQKQINSEEDSLKRKQPEDVPSILSASNKKQKIEE